MSRMIGMLVSVMAAGGLALTGLLTAAGAASAATAASIPGPDDGRARSEVIRYASRRRNRG